MTRFLGMVMGAWFLTACADAGRTTVSVHVEGRLPGRMLELVTEDSVYSSALDSTGSAAVVLAEAEGPAYASVRYAGVSVPVYVEAGRNFDLDMRLEGRKVTVAFTGEGARENVYLNGKSGEFCPDFGADEEGFIAGLEREEKALSARLDSMDFSPSFSCLEKRRIHYRVYSWLPQYAFRLDSSGSYFPLSGHYYEVLEAAVGEEEGLIGFPEYRQALAGRVSACTEKKWADDPWVLAKKQLDYIRNNIGSPLLTEYLVDYFSTRYVNDAAGVAHWDEIAGIYDANVHSADKKTAFRELCGRWAEIAPGRRAPEFGFRNIDGGRVGLQDWAGKYVYMEIGASWCGACRREGPCWKSLVERFKDRNIVFVGVSCDRDRTAWERSVKMEEAGGIQLYSGNDATFMEAYMVRELPRFILIDREGRIVSARMTSPSDPRTEKTLEALEGI